MPKIHDENKTRLSALAQFIDFLSTHHGITDTNDLMGYISGYNISSINKAKRELRMRTYSQMGTYSQEPMRNCEPIPANLCAIEEPMRNSPRVHARIENPSGLNNIINTSPLPPKRKIEVSGGVISHPGFQISLDAIELDTFGSIPMETIRRVCEAEAMQWALEIDAGKLPMDVLPNKIRPYLSAQVRKAHDRTNQPQSTKEKGGVYALLESEGYFQ